MKTGYHAVYAANFFDGIDDALKYGFDFVQFDLGVPTYFINGLSAGELSEIRKHAQSRGVEISFHAPGDNVSLFCDYPVMRQSVIDGFKEMLEKADIIGARHMTFHTGNYPMFKKAGSKADDSRTGYYEEVLFDNLKTLIENSGGVMVCVENSGLNKTARKALQRLIDVSDRLYLTLDIAKMYVSWDRVNEEDFGFFEKNRERIREVHIHDKNDSSGSHQIVGDGYVDFLRFQPFFNENTYLNFEVRLVGMAKRAKDNLFDFLGKSPT